MWHTASQEHVSNSFRFVNKYYSDADRCIFDVYHKE